MQSGFVTTAAMKWLKVGGCPLATKGGTVGVVKRVPDTVPGNAVTHAMTT